MNRTKKVNLRCIDDMFVLAQVVKKKPDMFLSVGPNGPRGKMKTNKLWNLFAASATAHLSWSFAIHLVRLLRTRFQVPFHVFHDKIKSHKIKCTVSTFHNPHAASEQPLLHNEPPRKSRLGWLHPEAIRLRCRARHPWGIFYTPGLLHHRNESARMYPEQFCGQMRQLPITSSIAGAVNCGSCSCSMWLRAFLLFSWTWLRGSRWPPGV